MAWRKLGRIFVPNGDPSWMVSHAAVPTPYRLSDELVRVYFTSRDGDNRSMLAYLDIELRGERIAIVAVSPEPLLRPGSAGQFDDRGAMLSSLVEHQGLLYAYYVGWNLGVDVPFRNAIGLALLDPAGQRIVRRLPGPILDRNAEDPCFVTSPFVVRERDRWRMWYSAGSAWIRMADGMRPHYHIKYAESSDGIVWRRDNRVCIDFNGPDEYAFSRPWVIRSYFGDSRYSMWYSYRGESYRIGYAESADGLYWQRRDERAAIGIADSGWESEMIEYAAVFYHHGLSYLLYNGNDYGRSGFGIAVWDT